MRQFEGSIFPHLELMHFPISRVAEGHEWYGEMLQREVRKNWSRELPHVEKAFSIKQLINTAKNGYTLKCSNLDGNLTQVSFSFKMKLLYFSSFKIRVNTWIWVYIVILRNFHHHQFEENIWNWKRKRKFILSKC